MKAHSSTYDVIVIGGGASGLIAAIHAGRGGARVLILEKNNEVGNKLSISGGGRCNIWNEEHDLAVLTSMYGEAADSLKSLLTRYGVGYVKTFFTSIGVPTYVEDRKRAFPVSQSAKQVRDALLSVLVSLRVEIICSSVVRSIIKSGSEYVIQTSQGEYTSRACILATGGLSHPETGSTGDGFTFVRALGHTIKAPTPSLAPLITSDTWSRQLQGVTLEGAHIRMYVDGVLAHAVKRKDAPGSRILFTHDGLSGPTIINLSPIVQDALPTGEVTFSLNPYPHMDEGELRTMLRDHLDNHKNKSLKNALILLPAGRVIVAYLEAGLGNTYDLECKVHSVSREQRQSICKDIQSIQLTVTDIKNDTHAIITDGGVSVRDIDMKTSESKVSPGLYITGDMLDVRRPSGGYSLLLAWATGIAAGISVTAKVSHPVS